jgi:general secretion pathway protein C
VKTPLALSLLCAASLALAAAPAPVLTGVILDGGDSVAFISSEPGRDRTYRVGDALPGGAVLASIEVTRVTLLAGGHRETLPLKGLDTHSVPTGASAGKLPVRAIPAHADAFLIPMAGITYISDTHFIITRDKLHTFLNSPRALSEARWMLQKDGGLFIARIQDGSAYEKAGLHVGDVITRINGRELKSGDDVMAVYGDLDKLQHLDITLERMGQEQHLVYDIQP